MLPDGKIYPCYLTSFEDTINSIEKCRKLRYKKLSLPHRGIVSETEVENFFVRALKANIIYRDFILTMKKNGVKEIDMPEKLFQEYVTNALLSVQPKEAFIANAYATIKCTLKEFANQI